MSLSAILNKSGQTEPGTPSRCSQTTSPSSCSSLSPYNKHPSSAASPGAFWTSPVSFYSDRMTPASYASKQQHVQVQPDDVTTEFVRARPKGAINFPPFESHLGARARREVQKFSIYPFGDIEEYSRHIPYASGKKDFHEKTGRESFEVFQYVYKLPGEMTEYHVMWDYNIGLVRMTPFFKCCKYSKTTPAKMLNLNPGLRDITHSITGGSIMAQGYWMPYSCAKAVCATFCYHISGALIPLFGPDFPNECIPPHSPDFGRMVINPAIVIAATQEAGEMRRLYATGSSSGLAKYTPPNEHQAMNQQYLVRRPPPAPAEAAYRTSRPPLNESPAGGRPRSTRSASLGSSKQRLAPSHHHYQPVQSGRAAGLGPAPATIPSPMARVRLPPLSNLMSLPPPAPSWELPPLTEPSHPHGRQKLQTMHVATSRQLLSRSSANITAAAGGCGKLENYKFSNDTQSTKQSRLDRPRMTPAGGSFTPRERPFVPGPAARPVQGYNSLGSQPASSPQQSTRYESAIERVVYSRRDARLENREEHHADAVVEQDGETMSENPCFQSSACYPTPPTTRTLLTATTEGGLPQTTTVEAAANLQQHKRPGTAPRRAARYRARQHTATHVKAERAPTGYQPGSSTTSNPWSTTEMDAAGLLVNFRSSSSQDQDDNSDRGQEIADTGGGGETDGMQTGRDPERSRRHYRHRQDWAHSSQYAAAASAMLCEETNNRKHKRRRD